MLTLLRKLVQTLTVAGALSAVPAAAGPFVLDFIPDDINNVSGDLEARCNISGYANINCGNAAGGQADNVTPFFSEIVSDGTSNYYHQIIGSATSGFLLDMYIAQGGAVWQGGLGTTSAGTLNARSDPLNSDPAISGNGTANVQRVVLRQAHGDLAANGDCAVNAVGCEQFYKMELDRKPRIVQRYSVANEMSLEFMNDMSDKTFADRTAIDPANNTNTLTLLGPDAPVAGTPGPAGGDGDFDIHTDSQTSRITAGAYTWAAGAGPGQSRGTWTYYADGPAAAPTIGMNPESPVNWAAFFDSAQNTPWSYPALQPP